MEAEELLGQRLTQLREGKGWTLRHAAQLVGLSHHRLAELERGRSRGTNRPTRPSRAVVVKLAEAYGEPKNYMLELAGYAAERAEPDDSMRLAMDIMADFDGRQRRLALAMLRAIAAEP